ncbi:MAG: YkgJ family cysteine cluster protein [Candidatus Jordarchaeum sp.]|uniref:YkgJ family cysteine cluster protein n=1 Tax=Candidatus Jordarchaeum sp. TaxID=2823881 RepID=UPI0040495105
MLLQPQIQSFSQYIPWSEIKSWRCLGCGVCCWRFNAVLSPFEYVQFLQTFGSEVIEIDSLGNPHIRKIENRCMFQTYSGLCALQPLGMKPLACKLWPFAVYGEENSPKPQGEATFYHRGHRYYIYVNPQCLGVNMGHPKEYLSTLHEVVNISLDPLHEQKYSTFHYIISA